MHGDRFRNNPKDQSQLFTEYYSQQFAERSKYDLDFHCPGNSFIELRFETDDIYHILKNLNLCKASGPDEIHGKVFKYCARIL